MLYEKYHLELDYDKIISEVLTIEKKSYEWDWVSNKNGGIQIHETSWEKIPQNFYAINHMIREITRFISIMENRQVVLYSWLNINYPMSFNKGHMHHGTPRSGVYYVKTPEDCGNLLFSENNEEVQPKPGMLITFDATTVHAVTPNFSDDTRISFAFNY